MAVTELIHAHGYEGAMKRLFEWGFTMGHAYLLRMERELKKFKLDVPTLKFFGRAAWYLFSGTDPEIEVNEKKVEEGSYFEVIVRDRESPWDSGFKLGKKAAFYPAGAYEGASNTFALIVAGGKWYAVCRNTKSLAAGDDYTEIFNVYIPVNRPPNKVINDYSQLFDFLDLEYSLKLYEKTFGPLRK